MGVEIFLKSKVLCITHNNILSFRKGKLLLSSYDNPRKIRQSCRLKHIMTNLGQRLFRLEPRLAMPIDETHYLVTFNGAVLNYDVATNTVTVEHVFEKGMKNPLNLCSFVDSKGQREFYYGEYIWNTEKGEVSIYKRMGNAWQVVYSFPQATIAHIHNIIYDSKNERFIILTGDEDSESAIWVADMNFTCVKKLIGNKQKYRSCVAFIEDNYLIYATDTPLENNYIYKLNLSTLELTTICNLPGSCIYGTKIENSMYFATAVEPDSSLPVWRYRLTRKLGKGIKDRYSHLYSLEIGGAAKEIFKLKKDFYPLWLFQFGNMMFPYNETDELFITTQSVKPKHGVTIRL